MSARAEVARWAGTLPQDVAFCREAGHSWSPHDAWFDKDRREYKRILRCARCGATKSSWITVQGLQHGSYYRYPQGYRAPDGTGFLSREERGAIRLRSMGI